MSIGDRFKEIRENLRFNQSELARSIDANPSIISDIERGEKEPSKKIISALIINYKINSNWLLTGEGNMFIKSSEAGIISTGQQVPLLRQKVSCGVGQHWEDEINIDRYVSVFDLVPSLKTGKAYAFPVSGSSMLGAGIKDGDIVLFEANKDQDTHDGIYVFSLDGDVYCKRLEFDALTRQIKVFSVRVADLEKAELAMSFKADDSALSDRLHIFGRVFMWIHPDNWGD
ncbi:MAG: helix-turn-helix domain-containing protein [Treponema sp.]|nr:helix-turn-helix domain-containing protein [Treponema sp.]